MGSGDIHVVMPTLEGPGMEEGMETVEGEEGEAEEEEEWKSCPPRRSTISRR